MSRLKIINLLGILIVISPLIIAYLSNSINQPPTAISITAIIVGAIIISIGWIDYYFNRRKEISNKRGESH